MSQVEHLQLISDPREFLATSRSLLIAAHEKSRLAVNNCANEISSIWNYVKDRGEKDARLGRLITDWQQSIYIHISPKEIQRQLACAKRSKKRRDLYEDRVQTLWGMSSHDALGLGPGEVSIHILQYLALLVKVVDRQEGLRRIADKVEERVKAIKKGNGWRQDRHPTTQDVKAVLEQVKSHRKAEPKSGNDPIDVQDIPTIRGRSDVVGTEKSLLPQRPASIDNETYLPPNGNCDEKCDDGRSPHNTRSRRVESQDNVRSKTEDPLPEQGLPDHYGTPELARRAATPADTDGDFSTNDGYQFEGGSSPGSSSPICILSDEEGAHNNAADLRDHIDGRGVDDAAQVPNPGPKRRRLNPIIKLDDPVSQPSSPWAFRCDTPIIHQSELITPQDSNTEWLTFSPSSHDQVRSAPASDRYGIGRPPSSPRVGAIDCKDTSHESSDLYEVRPTNRIHHTLPSTSDSEQVQLNDVVEQQMPTTDIEGACSSFDPRCLVSASAIELILSSCASPEVKIFDPQAWRLAEPDPLKSFKIDLYIVTSVLLPLYKAGHWTLAFFDLQCSQVWYYDSLVDVNGLGQTEFPTATRRSFEMFLSALGLKSDSWTFSYGKCPVQTNDYDCGIHLLVSALHLITRTKSRAEDDCDLWRSIFTGILSSHDQPDFVCPLHREEEKTAEIDCEDLLAIVTATRVQKERLLRAKTARASAVAALDIIEILTNQFSVEINDLATLRDQAASDQSQLIEIVSRYSALHTALRESTSLQLRAEAQCANRNTKNIERRLAKANKRKDRWMMAKEAVVAQVPVLTGWVGDVRHGISQLQVKLKAHHQAQEEAAKRRMEILEDLEEMVGNQSMT